MKTRLALLACFTFLVGGSLLEWPAYSQRPAAKRAKKTKGFLERLIEFQEMERRGLAPFKGVTTTDGKVVSDLFPIQSTGVSTEPVVKAAKTFLAALSESQRDKTMFPVDDPEWRKWMNQHFYQRQGVGFTEMDDSQREAAFNLMRSSLSARGFNLSRDIMKLNHTLAELTDNWVEFGEWVYWITIMGEPSMDKPWGWQIDGHHLIVNYFVLGDQVVMTPTFVGSEPVIAESGIYKGVSVMQPELKKGVAVAASLDASQRDKAVVQAEKTRNNTVGEAFKDNVQVDYAGLRVAEMTPNQKDLLLDLIGEWVGYMDDGHARVKMDEVKAHLDDTYFAWVGQIGEEEVFYYRIHSPVVLIEFDQQSPIALPGPRRPVRTHVHAVMRTPNGNDYGKDLLRQHLEKHHNQAD